MPLMPWWAPAVLALMYVAGTYVLRLIPKSRVEDRAEQPRQQAERHDRQYAEHADERYDHDHGVAGGAAWVPAGLGSHGAESGGSLP